ncbi:HIRAN domain-containing protein [Pseudonocardia asaccharolytica]|uniref:HIRAN domain-containing protein n=1 Tax=Pseudonocardia asaccharolytica TaxID=54010 RepID=UPI000688ACEE|nr:HIRAN domain-containing protein [Pseudonocardia asaccharolytica]
MFPIPRVESDGSTTCLFLVHGIRHVTGGRLPQLSPGERLVLQEEPENPINSDAVRVCTRTGQPLGYVPDLLLEHLRVLQRSGPVAVTVEHVNGPEAPAHLRLLARLDGRAPVGYEPMSGPGWETF